MTAPTVKGKTHFYAGTSGLVLPVPNKKFYPEVYRTKSRLCFYSSLFNSIEINSSFYKLPRKSTVSKWADEVNKEFKFSYKLWREITHKKELAFDPENIYQFMESVAATGKKKGCILIQFPGKISIDHTSQINKILNHIGKSDDAAGWSIHVEFRNPSLYHAEMYAVLREHNAGLVLQDMKKAPTPLHAVDSQTIYLRFHGPEDAFRGSYDDEFLQKHAIIIKNWLKAQKQVFAYFNNTLGSAVHDLARLNAMVRTL